MVVLLVVLACVNILAKIIVHLSVPQLVILHVHRVVVVTVVEDAPRVAVVVALIVVVVVVLLAVVIIVVQLV